MDAAAEANLERLLTPIVGPGNVTAVVHYQLSMQSTTSHQTLVQSSTPISVSKLTKKSTGTSGSLAVGTAGNTAPTYPATTGTSSSSVNKSSTQYVVGHVTTATTTPAGLVSTVTASVIVNQKALKLTRANIASIRSAVGMALGIAAKQQAADISVLSAPYAAVPVAPVSTTKLGRTRLLEMGAGAAVLALGIIFLLTRRRRRRPDAGVGVSGPLAPQYAPPAAAPDTVMESRVQTVVTKISRISQESPTEVADALTRLIGQDALRPADYDEREPLA
jgi:flagellar biosynthesis/type III secretory pathway M-ring protein FliF/YscJ